MLLWLQLVKTKHIQPCILNGEIKTPGVQIPITKEVYTPILNELSENGIEFHEKEVPYLGYNPLNA